MADDTKPIEQDIRSEDHEYNPALEPTKAKAWLNLLRESEDAFEEWNNRCDNIDKQYANLMRLADMYRDKEFQMFWANCEVLKPAIYAKPPVPVVVPKFKDRRPVYQAASELMERVCIVAFDLTRINDLMILIRDDLALTDRGVAWCRYESGKGDSYYDHEKVCIDFKGRHDFLHSVSRNWREVTWVAAASYLTRSEARKRFSAYSGDAYQEAEYRVDKDSKEIGGADARERAKFWEIWHKGSRRVLWVSEGCEDILDEADPHLDLQNFFPCPKPAYGTTQRGSLVPVPDVLQYRDQLEEINLLTGRIHALSDALEAKGFYPAGGAELSDAVQAAIAVKTPGRMLIPISNWAAFGGSKEVIIWLPIDMISTTITALVMLRKQVIDDIYQIMGLADIMRGDTDAQETLGAQQLKTQYGSTRIRDKQQELVRLARDLVEITSEIVTEKFSPSIMIEMSQTQLPQNRDIEKQVRQVEQQIQQQMQAAQQQIRMQIAAPPQPGQPPGPPQQGQQIQQAQAQMQQLMQQAQTQIQKLQAQPTIEQVLTFLKNNRAKSFVLDIETDSTIMVDEMGEKAARTEFVGVLGQLLPQLAQMIAGDPKTAPFCGELLKFATAPFRAGRSLDGAIDELVEQMKVKGEGAQGPDPTTATNQTAIQIQQMKDQTEQMKIQQDGQFKQAQLAQADQHKQADLANQRYMKQMELSGQAGDQQADMAVQTQKMQESREAHQAEMAKAAAELQVTQQKMQLADRQHAMKQTDMAARQNERQQAAQLKAQQVKPGGPI